MLVLVSSTTVPRVPVHADGRRPVSCRQGLGVSGGTGAGRSQLREHTQARLGRRPEHPDVCREVVSHEVSLGVGSIPGRSRPDGRLEEQVRNPRSCSDQRKQTWGHGGPQSLGAMIPKPGEHGQQVMIAPIPAAIPAASAAALNAWPTVDIASRKAVRTMSTSPHSPTNATRITCQPERRA